MMTTDTPIPKPSRHARPNPITFITDGTIAARFWMLLAVIAFAGWAIIPQVTIRSIKQQQMVAIVDQSGNIIYAPLVGFQESASFTPIMCGLHALRCYNATRMDSTCPS
jgi:uncharacterized SAM-binding protein YcdF (DUF218 family)